MMNEENRYILSSIPPFDSRNKQARGYVKFVNEAQEEKGGVQKKLMGNMGFHKIQNDRSSNQKVLLDNPILKVVIGKRNF